MRENHAKEKLLRGEPVFGCAALGTHYPELAHTYAASGFDFLLIENEHWPMSLESDQLLVRAARAADITAITRVPDAEYHLVARTLDTGAEGIIVPRVETPERAAEVVSWSRFPPEGRRGCGPGPLLYDYESVPLPEALEHWNRNTLVVIQAESQQAIERIDEIAAVPGLDAIMIGPADLSISLGIPLQLDHPDFVRSVEAVSQACANHSIISGMFMGDVERVKRYVGLGMRLFSCGGDIGLIRQAGTELVTKLRAGAQEVLG
ncbi:MAG: aldolase [Armatimonadota bacterium]|nr:MAG: aldolase [Armatimonadota bacterium]